MANTLGENIANLTEELIVSRSILRIERTFPSRNNFITEWEVEYLVGNASRRQYGDSLASTIRKIDEDLEREKNKI